MIIDDWLTGFIGWGERSQSIQGTLFSVLSSGLLIMALCAFLSGVLFTFGCLAASGFKHLIQFAFGCLVSGFKHLSSSVGPAKPTPRQELLKLEVQFQRDRIAIDSNWAPLSPAQGLLAAEGLKYKLALEVAKFQNEAYSLAKGEKPYPDTKE